MKYTFFFFLRAGLSPAGEGDLRDLSEDGLSSGEVGGQPARVPQLVLPLLALQHQTEVRSAQTQETMNRTGGGRTLLFQSMQLCHEC